MPIGPGFPQTGPPIIPGFAGGSDEAEEPLHRLERCKRCGKEAELVGGLCQECRWEIEVGIKPPVQQEEKHHFWQHEK